MVAIISCCHGDFGLDNSPSTTISSLLSEEKVSPYDEHILHTL